MKLIVWLLSCIIAILITSCNNGNAPEESLNTGEPIKNDTSNQKFYFSGYIRDTLKYYEDGKDSFEIYCSGNAGSNFRFLVCGFEKMKETLGNEGVTIVFPNLINVDSTNYESFFKLGYAPFSNIYDYYQTGYVVCYYITSCVAGTCHDVYRSCYGKQDDSYIKIIERNYIHINKNKFLKLVIELKCNLYSMGGGYFGKIENGKMVIYIYI